MALTHGMGCATDSEGEELRVLRRTLGGYARHANFAAVLVVGLGCETNQIQGLIAQEGLQEGARLAAFSIQDTGGTAKTVARGVELVKALLPEANRVQRQPVPASHLVVGLQCGGSDGYSGISANPALGAAVDRLVRHGGTAILSETPEVYGGEHLLTRRAASPAVAEKLLARIRWWEAYTARNGMSMDNNPSAGNKAGGLTTILEKSLGAIAKSGTTRLEDVVEFAERITARGFVYMDSPGYDPVSATGQVASGANLICFTTGRGSAYGCAPAPSLKLATNTALWLKQQEDMDLNCGAIVDGDETVDAAVRAHLPAGAGHCLGRAQQERAARLWAERVRALAAGRGDVGLPGHRSSAALAVGRSAAAVRLKGLAGAGCMAESPAIATRFQPPKEPAMTTQAPLSAPRHQLASLGLAVVTTLAVMLSMTGLADGYRQDALLAQAKTPAAPASQPQQVVVVVAVRASKS